MKKLLKPSWVITTLHNLQSIVILILLHKKRPFNCSHALRRTNLGHEHVPSFIARSQVQQENTGRSFVVTISLRNYNPGFKTSLTAARSDALLTWEGGALDDIMLDESWKDGKEECEGNEDSGAAV